MSKDENKEEVKKYSGEVISKFTVRGGIGKKVKEKTYKVGDTFETTSLKGFEKLKTELKIKK